MMNQFVPLVFLLIAAFSLVGCALASPQTNGAFENYVLNFETPVDPLLQGQLEKIDETLRAKYGLETNQTSVGLLDLKTLRWAALRPDHEEYGASVPKIGILLAYFELHPEAVTNLDAITRHELGLMAKASNNELAAKFSEQLGLKNIQAVLDKYQLYDANHGGGIWVGKHYGKDGERYPDPVGNNSCQQN